MSRKARASSSYFELFSPSTSWSIDKLHGTSHNALRPALALMVACMCVLSSLPTSLISAAEENPVDGPKPTLVINLTSGISQLHSVVMGLHFAEHGLADGREVVIFFNVKAPPLARANLAESVKFQQMPPVRDMISSLLKSGAKMVVCPMCAKITGVQTDQLAKGIEMIEDRQQIFKYLHGNTVVFTY